MVDKKYVRIFLQMNAIISVLFILYLAFQFSPNIEYEVGRNLNPKKYSTSYYQSEDKMRVYAYQDILVIPSIASEVPLFIGTEEKLLEKGAWMKTTGVMPSESGKSIITGHRYSYLWGSRPFYNLDKVRLGDNILIFWKGEKYQYKITGREIVDEYDISIEDQPQIDNGNLLVIYTCADLRAKKRLVIYASPSRNFAKTL